MTENCNEDYKLISNLKNGLTPKITYNQYKHLIDVFTTGDFLIESLDKSVGLVTYRKLITEDNILYFTQNTKRTCNVALGVNKKNKELKMIDLMNRTFCYRHNNVEVLRNLAKLIICNLMQNYKPSEYKVYYDFEIKGLEDLECFQFIPSNEELFNVYEDLSNTRSKKYFRDGSYNYRNYRKHHDDRLIVFITLNPNNIKLLNSVDDNPLNKGIAIVKLEYSEISNSSTISLDNTVRPIITECELDTEIEIYKRMLGEYNNMINQINVLTGEILNEGSLHEELVVQLPFKDEEKRLADRLKERISSLDADGSDYQDLLEELKRGNQYAIYNMREYGYQFGGFHANGDYGSFYHHLFNYCEMLDKDGIGYLVSASVCTLFSHSSSKLNMALRGQKDLSESDKKILDDYIDRQVKHYNYRSDGFDFDYFAEGFEDRVDSTIVLYNQPFCKVEFKNRHLVVTVNDKEIELPQSLVSFVDLSKGTININMLELIIRYSMYEEYGLHCPSEIEVDGYYTDSPYNKINPSNEGIKPSTIFNWNR